MQRNLDVCAKMGDTSDSRFMGDCPELVQKSHKETKDEYINYRYVIQYLFC